MARVIDTSTLSPDSKLDRFTDDAVYNGLDCCVTLEVLEALQSQLTNTTASTYAFSMSLAAPVLEMNLHGVRIDRNEVSKAITSYREDIAHVRANLDYILKEGVGYDKPWTGKGGMDSRIALMEIFYDVLRLPPVRKRNAEGKYVPTVNRQALEKLKTYTIAEPIVKHILAMRDLGKKIAFLFTQIDPDGRIRTQFNIGGTVTGRLSSAFSAEGTGSNLQNVERRLRRVFISDPGYKFCNVDLEQADARNMGAILYNLFLDRSYLDACSSGDLHTTVCRLVWPNLPWTGEPRQDRKIADEPFYRDLSRRDACKRLGHGSNYLGQASTMSINTKIPLELVKEFQRLYFERFPNILEWHKDVRYKLKHDHSITTLLGRKRNFFGRPDDEAVIREAVAFEPQSMTADEIDEVLRTLWRSNTVEPLLQVHDSILFQYKQEQEQVLIPQIIAAPFTFMVRDISFFVPMEAKVGWNWADVEYNKDGSICGNPNGLIKYRTGGDVRNVDR